jgi:hypothetical protein
VSPEFGVVLPVRSSVCIVLSNAPTGNRPENSLAVAAWPLPLFGNVSVMVSTPSVNAITLCAEKIARRALVVVTGISTSML